MFSKELLFLFAIIVLWMRIHTQRTPFFAGKMLQNDAKNKTPLYRPSMGVAFAPANRLLPNSNTNGFSTYLSMKEVVSSCP